MAKDNIVWFSQNESGASCGKVISALIDVRLTLMLKKLTSDTILRREFREVVSEAKLKVKDPEVEKVLDEVFDEYLGADIIGVKNVQQTVEQKINEYSSDDGASKGTTLVKRNHYKSSESSPNADNVDVKPAA